ncbi:hypothetical protein C0Q70_21478 [Pomacea canaliculata]|uniref:Uncharacterized protein n=1 Tax=Pomacea canaliculata TaxID=400727 RepID=A0A2T7NCL7_POMCA|nr:hypothetical protein C0Q70_21478 [Pomacea canaliculata]
MQRDSDWSVRPDSDMCPSKEDHYKFVFWTPSQPVSKWNCTSRRVGKGKRGGGENKFFNMPYFSVRKAEIPDFKQTWKKLEVHLKEIAVLAAQVVVEKSVLKYDFGTKPPAGVKFRWTANGNAELYTDHDSQPSSGVIPEDVRKSLGNGQVKIEGNYVIVEFNKTPKVDLTEYQSCF